MTKLYDFCRTLYSNTLGNPLDITKNVIFFSEYVLLEKFQNLLHAQHSEKVSILPQMYVWTNLNAQHVRNLTHYCDPREHTKPPSQRLFLLAHVIMATSETQLPFHQAYAMAQSLAPLIDFIYYENIDIHNLSNLVPSHLKDQWMITVNMLRKIFCEWTQQIQNLGLEDQSQSTSLAWKTLHQKWLETPPQFPIFCVGEIPPFQALNGLKQWLIKNYPENIITANDMHTSTHPLYTALTAHIIPHLDDSHLHEYKNKFTFCELQSDEEEIQTAVSIIAHHLSDKDKTVSIINACPDVKKKIRWLLTELNPKLENQFSATLSETSLGYQTIRIAESLKTLSSQETCLDLEKAFGQNAPSLWAEEYKNRYQQSQDSHITQALSSIKLPDIPPKAFVHEYVTLHKTLCQQYLNLSFQSQFPENKQIKELWSSLISQNYFSSPVSCEDYTYMWKKLCESEIYKSPRINESRLSFVSLESSEFHSADVMIMMGMNEKTNPLKIKETPWIPTHLLEKMGLIHSQWKKNLCISNILHISNAQAFYFLRAQISSQQPQLPSSLWIRLITLLDITPQSKEWNLYTRNIATVTVPQPHVWVSVENRPNLLSATEIESLMRDPYIIFAKKILNLRPLKPFSENPTAADRGNFIHLALELFIKNKCNPQAPQALSELLTLAHQAATTCHIPHTYKLLWWPRFERIAQWFLHQQCTRATNLSYVEIWGHCDFKLDNGSSFRLRAKVDRLDISADYGVRIIDYKTGVTPSKSDVRKGFSPQLALEGLIFKHYGFAHLQHHHLEALEFWSLTGGNPAGDITSIDEDLDDLLIRTEDGLLTLLNYYQQHETRYTCNAHVSTRPAYNDYDDLSRYQLWGNKP